MQQKIEQHIFEGMQMDIAVSKHPSKYLTDAQNIRITSRGEDTLLSITNEQGPEDLNITIKGTYLGHAVINSFITVFSTTSTEDTVAVQWNANGGYWNSNSEEDNSYDGVDYITRIDISEDNPDVKILYGNKESHSSLGFNINYPIEALGSYENEKIQKVYWTDGLNQPRVINIANLDKIDTYDSLSFDFVQELKLEENVRVIKELGTSGEFAPGTIQYSFSYYNKYGQESNIFYTTPILYTSHNDRGGSPEDKVRNSFRIIINNIDHRFDYLRIYSIQRTSIDATPYTKRVVDLNIDADLDTIEYVDTGTNGASIDPTELLYIGGEEIVAGTLDQKDNTLFFGDLKIGRPQLDKSIQSDIQNYYKNKIKSTYKQYYPTNGSKKIIDLDNLNIQINEPKVVLNSLTAYNTDNSTSEDYKSVNSSGFKSGETYRCGIQFQYKNGKWSNPIFIDDFEIPINNKPQYNDYYISIPQIEYPKLSQELINKISVLGYKKVRGIIVVPTFNDRTILCQGIVCPTMYTDKFRNNKLYAQSSWFFRPVTKRKELTTGINSDFNSTNVHNPVSYGELEYINNNDNFNPSLIRYVEIQGDFEKLDNENESAKYKIDWSLLTFHSPECVFDTWLYSTDLKGIKVRHVGDYKLWSTASDIDIQTKTPTLSASGDGFVHKSFEACGLQPDIAANAGGIITGLYYDDFVADNYSDTHTSIAWEHEKSSAKWFVYAWNKSGSLNNDANLASSKRSADLDKKIISNSRSFNTKYNDSNIDIVVNDAKFFSSDQATIIKINNKVYQANIDLVLNPTRMCGQYFCHPIDVASDDSSTSFNSKGYHRTYIPVEEQGSTNKIKKIQYYEGEWKAVSHSNAVGDSNETQMAVQKEPVRMKYKSTPHIVLQLENEFNYNQYLSSENGDNALPIFELYRDNVINRYGGTSETALKDNLWIPAGEAVSIESSKIVLDQGDTWFGYFECLKTYSFTPQDINQIIEIGSFYVESHVNMDGRYDRNKAQVSNLYMSPINFNLFNPVYNQLDNFYNYRVLDDDFYTLNDYPNQITWTKEKQFAAETDLWTNVTMASTYSLDGTKGKIESLNVWKDNIYCFQNKGVSEVIFNPRVQIPTSDGIPIEITNNYKLQGHRYISDGIGCNNKQSIKVTPAGVYFIDSISNNLYHIGGQGADITDISTSHNMASWFANNSVDKTLYDDVNHDLYLINNKEALCYSEILNQFVSRMSYDNLKLLESYNTKIFSLRESKLYRMFKGEYNKFFNKFKPWHIKFVSNGMDQNLSHLDKVFSNIDYRMDISQNDEIRHFESFNSLRINNEYQDTNDVALYFNKETSSNLKKKFRVWRIDVPRDKVNRRDRIRNTWCNVKLEFNKESLSNAKAVLHDINMIYYI